MRELGFIIWIFSFVLWLIFIICAETREVGLYLCPLLTMFLGNLFMFLS